MGVVAATALLSALTAGCGVVVCRRGRGRGHQPGHAPAPHWSTHVTVTPTVHHIYLVIFLSIFVYVAVRRSIGICFNHVLRNFIISNVFTDFLGNIIFNISILCNAKAVNHFVHFVHNQVKFVSEINLSIINYL